MDKKHTPEPWSVEKGDAYCYIKKGKWHLADIAYGVPRNTTEANAQRIVECVNAFAGIKNPVDFMEIVKQLELDAYPKLKEKMKLLKDDLHTALSIAHDEWQGVKNSTELSTIMEIAKRNNINL